MKHYTDDREDAYTNWDNPEELDFEDVGRHQKEIRRRLDERMERRRLKKELEDYEGELDDDFDWNE